MNHARALATGDFDEEKEEEEEDDQMDTSGEVSCLTQVGLTVEILILPEIE